MFIGSCSGVFPLKGELTSCHSIDYVDQKLC
jgi:hypothetical protein